MGASWEPLGGLLEASWKPCGSFWRLDCPKSAQEAPKRRPRGVQEAPRGAQRGTREGPKSLQKASLSFRWSKLCLKLSTVRSMLFSTQFSTRFSTFLLLILYCILVWFTDPLPIAITFFARRCDMRFVSYFTSRKACRSLREQHENIKKTQTNIRKTSSQNTRCADTHKYHIFSRILIDLASTLKPKSIKIQPQTRPKANLTPKSTLQRRSRWQKQAKTLPRGRQEASNSEKGTPRTPG